MPDDTYCVDAELLAEFVDETLELLGTVDGLFVDLEQCPDDSEVINAIFRPIHTIKGNSAFFGLMKVQALSHEMETLLDLVRNEKVPPAKPVINVLLAGVDALREMFERTRRDESEIPDEDRYQELVEAVKHAPETVVSDEGELWQELLDGLDVLKVAAEKGDTPGAEDIDKVLTAARTLAPDNSAPPQEPQEEATTSAPVAEEPSLSASTPTDGAKSSSEASKTMRVSEEHIDGFLTTVGELVVVQEMLRHLQDRLSDEDVSHDLTTEFRRVNEGFASLSNKLQKKVMAIRLVPVRSILQKVTRTVRNIAEASDKNITAVVEGQDTQVDKSLLDVLDACLTHMVRNAADHGVESPDDRSAAGKDPVGIVRVEVGETSDSIFMSVSDDGGGINYEAVRKKAISLGLIREGQELSEEGLVSILFAPGLSTAEKVTDVSGRGVGTNVIKRAVEEHGGSISVETTPGAGSTFLVQLPKSVHTQITAGLVVAVADERYVAPLLKVQECFHPTDKGIHTVIGKGECTVRHGRTLRVVRLDCLFDGHASVRRGAGEEIMVIVETGRELVALCVDEVIGVQQVVLKDIDGLAMRSGLFTGGALMGDGRVAMFLDLEAVCSHAAAA